jgi:hypothetical protein
VYEVLKASFVWRSFTALACSIKIFSDNRPRQMNKRSRRFEYRLGLHHQGCYVILEPMVPHI